MNGPDKNINTGAVFEGLIGDLFETPNEPEPEPAPPPSETEGGVEQKNNDA